MARQPSLSRKLALRIGLAVRALPNMQAQTFIDALISALSLPLTVKKLDSLSLERYQSLVATSYDIVTLKKSLAFLKAQDDESKVPQLQTYDAYNMPNSIRIAVASEDGVYLDGQFMLCHQFYIYQVCIEKQCLVDRRTTTTEKPLKSDEKQTYRADLISDCQMLYCHSIGALASAKIIKKGIYPIQLGGFPEITDVIEQLQQVLLGSPPPWLANYMLATKKNIAHTREGKTYDN